MKTSQINLLQSLAETHPNVFLLDIFLLDDFIPIKWLFTDNEEKMQCLDISDQFSFSDVVMSIAKNLQVKDPVSLAAHYDSLNSTHSMNEDLRTMAANYPSSTSMVFTNDDFIEVLENRINSGKSDAPVCFALYSINGIDRRDLLTLEQMSNLKHIFGAKSGKCLWGLQLFQIPNKSFQNEFYF